MMRELSLFDELPPIEKKRIVNVASVPQRSPWRYPGGKTWLVPWIRQWLGSYTERPRRLIEPFAGGGTVSLTVAFERLTVEGATMVELDADVSATWKTILNGNANWLADQICSFDLSLENVAALAAQENQTERERGFLTLVRNRIQHGGILAPGSGTLKNGENNRGIFSRWYPQTLRKRLLAIAQFTDRLEYIEGDGIAYMEQTTDQEGLTYFIDPPYTAGRKGKRAGTRLYKHFELDHERLFRVCESIDDFLMTYDNDPYVQELARAHGFDVEPVAMTGTHCSERRELLIGPNLDWARC